MVLCFKWDCCACDEGSVCRTSHQEALILTKKCFRGSHQTVFFYKYVGDIDMLEAATEYGNPVHIFLFKYPRYLMNILESWMTLDNMEGVNTKHKYKGRDGESLVKFSNIGSHLDFNFNTFIW